MLTHVVFRSDEFPAYASEDDEVNPGRFGKRLALYLSKVLAASGETVQDPIAEDWGWVVPVNNEEFRLWIGVGNYEEYPNGFLCFIEPSREYVRKLFRKIPTRSRVEEIQEKVATGLERHSGIQEIQWWTKEAFDKGQIQ